MEAVNMKKQTPQRANLRLLLAVLVVVLGCLVALNQIQPTHAVHINIYKHRYPFYGGHGYYPFYGGYGGYGYGGINIGGYGRRR